MSKLIEIEILEYDFRFKFVKFWKIGFFCSPLSIKFETSAMQIILQLSWMTCNKMFYFFIQELEV